MTYADNDRDWQEKVCGRSGGQCSWPGCGSVWKVSGHHIFDRRYSELRLVLENGVCLCGQHHLIIGTSPKNVRTSLSKLLIGSDVYYKLAAFQVRDNIKPSVPLSSRDTGRLW